MIVAAEGTVPEKLLFAVDGCIDEDLDGKLAGEELGLLLCLRVG